MLCTATSTRNFQSSDSTAGPSYHRAASEPPMTNCGIDTDVEMASPHRPLRRAASHWDIVDIHSPSLLFPCPTLDEISESQELSQNRSQSPAPTEIDDPEPEHIESKLASLGSKIRDFAYEKPQQPLTPIAELFDQYEAIAEFEYRVTEEPRVYPITGKTLRRLLDIGWVDQKEVDMRCDPMDLEELAKADNRPAYPYILRFIGWECKRAPTAEERYLLVQSRKGTFARVDRLRSAAEEREKLRKERSQEAQRVYDAICEKQRKRPLDHDGESEKKKGKRRRRDDLLSDEFDWESSPPPFSQPQAPLRQYPAPLSSYDPELYPEAASSQSQQGQSSQPIPGLMVPPRSDTPPLEDERPNALKRPARGLKRTLSRTQTFTQL